MNPKEDMERAFEAGYRAGIEAAARLAASKAHINDMGTPRSISLAIVELLRAMPVGSSDGP